MMAALWTDGLAARATGGMLSGRSWQASGVVIDSRKVTAGDLFVALVGERVDGHDFVGRALKSGAAAALVERRPDGLGEGAPLLVVDDVLAALARLGADARDRSTAKVLAVTGSVGKTGTKEALALALAGVGKVHASEGNLNNHIGAPLSLARLPGDVSHAVFELGMNHAGEIAPLSRLVRPDLAIITNVEPVHIGYFDGERDIALAKAEIFEGLEPGGVAVLNSDNAWRGLLAEKARAAGAGRIVTFGRDQGADIRLIQADADANGCHVDIEVEGRAFDYRLDAIGAHWAFNSIGVVACIHALGLDVETAAGAIRGLSAGRGRGGQVTVALASGGTVRLIDESYNASPAAMRAAFAVLGFCKPASGCRRIAVLGDMRELGESGPRLHAELGEDLLAAAPDLVFTAGPLMRELCAVLPNGVLASHDDVSAEIADAVANELRDGDVVLVKGSLGTNMAPIVAAIEALADLPDLPRRVAVNGR